MSSRTITSSDYVVFGATGDLTMRKLLPAMYQRFIAGELADSCRIIGTARSPLTSETYRGRAHSALVKYVPAAAFDTVRAARFLELVHYAALNGAESDSSWENLADVMAPEAGRERVRVFYLATAPNLYGDIARNLHEKGFVTPASRIVLEKPIGTSADSARTINDAVGRYFPEDAIYRIDHFLGKGPVQNILALRFANPLLERSWNRDAIEYVQITAAEAIGVEGRGDYYDGSGALRDMVQNHLLQILCLTAMERPASMEADALRDEKVRLLRALKPMTSETVADSVVRGQYVAGTSGSAEVPAYRDELTDAPASHTETFVALKAEIDNDRWRGVPFYIRSGKRLPKKVTEVVVHFRAADDALFGSTQRPARLVIRIDPNDTITMPLAVKKIAPGDFLLADHPLSTHLGTEGSGALPDAYEGLMLDAAQGYPGLFVRKDENEAAWQWVEPILESWANNPTIPDRYPAGTWGPDSARRLLTDSGHAWLEDAA